MIKEMRYKFILVSLTSLLLILIIMLGTIYILASYSNHKQVQGRMERVLQNDGTYLKNTENQPERTEFVTARVDFLNSTFAVKLDKKNSIIQIVGNAKEDYSEQEITSMVQESLLKGKSSGKYGTMNFLIGGRKYGAMIVFSDYSEQNYFLDNLFQICMIVGIFGCLLIGVLVFMLSYWVVGPAQKAIEKQKEFISNASHELRTPLTIISANAQLLEQQLPGNKWLGLIKANTEKMNSLVKELLNMSRMESTDKKPEFLVFNLSKTILNVTLSMESIIYEAHKTLDMELKEEIHYLGDQDKMKELTAILLDNALKYSNQGGKIKISLFEKNQRPVLEVFNTGDPIPGQDTQKIFDRFYRGERKENQSCAGFGLGLAIASSITTLHHGKIYVENLKDMGVKFVVKL